MTHTSDHNITTDFERDLSKYSFDLPHDRIAQNPVNPRDSARLLVYHRTSGKVEHLIVSDLPDILNKNDLLVTNTSKVIPARLSTVGMNGGIFEVFLLEPLEYYENQFTTADYHNVLEQSTRTYWRILCKPASRFRVKEKFSLSNGGSLEVLETYLRGERIVEIKFPSDYTFREWLNNTGSVPLPPYIDRKPVEEDGFRYQTVYAKQEGSVAAPTAGLHFTDALIHKLKMSGINFSEVVLHVGLGTFQPVKEIDITKHRILPETFEIPSETIDKINTTKELKGKVIAVGTTSTRVLESNARHNSSLVLKGKSELYIYPTFQFRVIDGLLTNFHLPKSSLFILICAFISREKALELYDTAVKMNYRFYSYGDACLFL